MADPDLDCPFCRIWAGLAPGRIHAVWDESFALEPLGARTDGHLLIVPKAHLPSASTDPDATGRCFARAAELANQLDHIHYNLITSAGRLATQTVMHLHIHLLPRRRGDGLTGIPWGSRHH
jgi:histidine triad (HIT) family protein